MTHENPAQLLARMAHRVLTRTVEHGPHSGWICAKTHAVNSYLRLRGRKGPKRHACPCCGWEGYAFRALDIGITMLPDIQCPYGLCLSHDRHRMMHLVLSRCPPDFMAKESRVLHFAPEPHIVSFLEARSNLKVVSSDLEISGVYMGMRPWSLNDIQAVGFADNSFDGVFCVHVLEHIPDDGQALREIHRILKPGGVAVIMVPFDPSLDATEEWGKPDPRIYNHVRNYAEADFPERLRDFEVEAIRAPEFLTADERERYKIRDTEVVFYCRKPATAAS